jgi:hypothetical protein
MKILSAALLCLLSIGFAGSAFADVREFGPASARFTIDVPSDWEATPTHSGVDLADQEKTTFVSISIGKVKGRTPEQIANTLVIANTFAKKRGYSKVIKKGPGLFALHGETDTGLRKTLVLFVENERYATCTMSGKDMEAVARITDTLKEKKAEAPQPDIAQDSAPAERKEPMDKPHDAGSPAKADASGKPDKP